MIEKKPEIRETLIEEFKNWFKITNMSLQGGHAFTTFVLLDHLPDILASLSLTIGLEYSKISKKKCSMTMTHSVPRFKLKKEDFHSKKKQKFCISNELESVEFILAEQLQPVPSCLLQTFAGRSTWP